MLYIVQRTSLIWRGGYSGVIAIIVRLEYESKLSSLVLFHYWWCTAMMLYVDWALSCALDVWSKLGILVRCCNEAKKYFLKYQVQRATSVRVPTSFSQELFVTRVCEWNETVVRRTDDDKLWIAEKQFNNRVDNGSIHILCKPAVMRISLSHPS